MRKIYYVPFVTKEGGWVRTNGYLISDDYTLLSKKAEEMPVDETNRNPNSREIRHLEINAMQMDMFLTKSVDGVLWGDDFELDLYKEPKE